MLVLVLLLVLAASGALVASVVLTQPEWSWLSVLLCVVGAAVLVVESVRRRRREASSPPAGHSAPAGAEPAETGLIEESPESESPDDASTRSSRTTVAGESTEPGTATGSRVTAELLAVEPGEENVDPVDMRQLGLSEGSVVVVDEHPRYHLNSCDWLSGRTTIPLSLTEARELGFTPCALCMPVARLANRWHVSR